MADHLTTAQSIIEQAGMKSGYIGAATSFFAGMTLNDVASLTGIMLAILGYLTSLYFQWRRDRREAAREEA